MSSVCMESSPKGDKKARLLSHVNSFRSAFGPGGQEDSQHERFGKIVDAIYEFIGESPSSYIDVEEVLRFLVGKKVIVDGSEKDIETVKNFMEGMRKDGFLKTSEPGSGIYRII